MVLGQRHNSAFSTPDMGGHPVVGCSLSSLFAKQKVRSKLSGSLLFSTMWDSPVMDLFQSDIVWGIYPPVYAFCYLFPIQSVGRDTSTFSSVVRSPGLRQVCLSRSGIVGSSCVEYEQSLFRVQVFVQQVVGTMLQARQLSTTSC